MTSPSMIQKILSISQQYTISTSFTIFIIGLIGNSLNIICFTKLKVFRNKQCIFYLIIESIADLGYLIFNFVLQFLIILYGSDLSPFFSIWCKLRTIIGQTLILFSLSVIYFVAIDQFLSTNSSIYLRQMSTLHLTRRLVVISLCLSLSHSVGFGIFFNAKPPVDCAISYSILTKYYSYFFYPILCGVLPILISGLVSFLTYRNVHHIIRRQLSAMQRRLDRQLTKFVFIRVIFLIILLVPLVTYRIYAIIIIIDPTDFMRLAIENLILAITTSIFSLNFAINFYIFFASSSRYRRQVKYILKKYWQQWKRHILSNRNQINSLSVPPIPSVELDNTTI